MLTQISEHLMHWIRWILTIAWLIIIASLFYDPWTPSLTVPNHPWSPLALTNSCILVQGKCLLEQPYPLATTLFWGAIVPGAIFILLVFGHEVWRRICPLSFLSQIPRALGKQRQFKRENPTTGKIRYELAKVKPDSWLGKNYPYVQFGWLFVGLCGRILFFNADRTILALWLLSTIAMAITVGYLYGGKSWCNYFCPMAPVQQIYSEPGGLLGTKAHTSDRLITQSMCRTVLPDHKEQSACVACQNPCIDIDAERAYWDGIAKPETAWLRYGYVGLVVGYFGYYYLYAGSWDYYMSGAWSRQTDQLASLLSPGFYVFGQAINVPKLFAVPITLGLTTWLGYRLGKFVENQIKAYNHQRQWQFTPELIKHRIFTICTFVIFNFFFIFGGRPLVQLMPIWVQYVYELTLVLLSTLWVYKTWRRSADLYTRENLASRFRKQLEKLQLDIPKFLEGRSLGDLNTHEVYILAKVLPGFTREKRHTAYKGVVRDALAEGYVNYSSSLQLLQQMRQELGITDDEHREVLEELGVEDPQLLNLDRQRSLESQIRLTGYAKSLERLMLLQRQQVGSNSLSSTLDQDAAEINRLRNEYAIDPQEEAWIMSRINPEAGNTRKAEFLLSQLPSLIACYRALHQQVLEPHEPVLTLLRDRIHHKKELIVKTVLGILVSLRDDPSALDLSHKLGNLNPTVLSELLEHDKWTVQLDSKVLANLKAFTIPADLCTLDDTPAEILPVLERSIVDLDPIFRAACLYIIAQLNLDRARQVAPDNPSDSPLVKEIADTICSLDPSALTLSQFPLLEKVVYLSNSDFFHRMNSETLITLAQNAQVRNFATNEVITEAGDTCRELLLLITGSASIQFYSDDHQVQSKPLELGQTLDELEVLAHSDSQNTIVANSEGTRILAVPVNAFDDLLDRDRDFSRRVLELESRQLQRFMGSLQMILIR
jgi:CRP-like cAMP-binding protein